jgi:hypothetical protein
MAQICRADADVCSVLVGLGGVEEDVVEAAATV